MFFDRQLLGDISVVLTNPAAPFGLHRQKPVPFGWQDTDFQTLLPTLEFWAQQLCLLKVKMPLSHMFSLFFFFTDGIIMRAFVFLLRTCERV